MRVNGRCHCGAIGYHGEVDPARVTICPRCGSPIHSAAVADSELHGNPPVAIGASR